MPNRKVSLMADAVIVTAKLCVAFFGLTEGPGLVSRRGVYLSLFALAEERDRGTRDFQRIVADHVVQERNGQGFLRSKLGTYVAFAPTPWFNQRTSPTAPANTVGFSLLA